MVVKKMALFSSKHRPGCRKKPREPGYKISNIYRFDVDTELAKRKYPLAITVPSVAAFCGSWVGS